MNTYIKKSLYILLGALTLTSCKETLEEYNPGGLTAENVYTTPEGFETLVNAAYSYQRWWYGKEEAISISEMGTDLWMSGAGDVYPDLTKYVNLQGTNGALRIEWQALYGGVNVCNAGLKRIDNANLTTALRPIREAELRFLRAFYLWHIVETWGGVHLSLEETFGIVTVANKTPVETFYNQIISDLEFAVKNLPPSSTDFGRVTKPAAQSFLARVYLFNGKNAEANNNARAVINGNYGFQLLPNFADLWKMSNLKNKEVVYTVNYSSNLALNDVTNEISNPYGHSRGSNSAHMLFTMKYDTETGMTRDIVNGRPFNRYMPTRFLLDLYSDNDARYEGSFQEVWYANNTDVLKRRPNQKVGDTAILATRKVITNASARNYQVYDRNFIYNTNGTVKDQLRYPSLSKFLDPTRPSFNEAQSARDAFVIRFAELYLIAAEAQLKLGRADSAAYYINFVRSRAAKPGKVAEMQISAPDVTLDFILDERAREFAGEQIRWYDLKRTGKLLERVQKYNPDVAPNIQPYHTVRPIPRTQLDAVTNKNEFTQNQGYQ
ncbi:RagB/SusD family nutrient uptake outer membrane protein [Desertivirga brevis]|uniref:RagB/SusD family nutrient uptake outer membrane protein n=1 Tax=Desertivirga brevis TaxID=2810310 RepID=UPI001A9575D0|nr:RagB/SusD family nutrient uptake outer membrane protein [Pedobacter sp. SYSU D00873]